MSNYSLEIAARVQDVASRATGRALVGWADCSAHLCFGDLCFGDLYFGDRCYGK